MKDKRKKKEINKKNKGPKHKCYLNMILEGFLIGIKIEIKDRLIN